MTNFSSITLKEWRQFSNVDIDLSNAVTVLTGQNGSGKTTILNTLNKHFGWNLNFVSTPYLGKKTAKKIWSDVYGYLEIPDDFAEEKIIYPDNAESHSGESSDPDEVEYQPDWIEEMVNESKDVGSIRYDNGNECTLQTQTHVSSQYQLSYAGLQAVTGLHIPSHRPNTVHQPITTIPTEPATAAKVYEQYQQLLQQSHNSPTIQNPGQIQKQSLISMMVFGEGNSSVQPNQEFVDIVSEFQVILRDIFPPELGFQRLEIRMPEIVLITRSGTFSLDAMSGGIGALFGLAWQIHMFGRDNEACTVTIDEPENHLHPSMQRSLLPNFAKAFPKYRFIVATHSPFIVTSFPDANVYGLIYNEERRTWSQQISVESHLLSKQDLAGTPNTVLREILDVDSNLPLWVENEIRAVYRDDGTNEEQKARQILDRLRELGITDALPGRSR